MEIQWASKTEWVPVVKMMCSDLAQRDLRPHHVQELLTDFTPDIIGRPVVSYRAGHFYIIDGHHRVEAFKEWCGEDWTTQKIECQCYNNLDVPQEAELFLRLNNRLAVSEFDKFEKGVVAKQHEAVAINRIVEGQGLRVSKSKAPGAVGAVAALRRIYQDSGADTLARTLRIIRDAFSENAFDARIVAGVGLICGRYNGALNEGHAIDRLSRIKDGSRAILQEASALRYSNKKAITQCVAAALVNVINGGRGSAKLQPWWHQ